MTGVSSPQRLLQATVTLLAGGAAAQIVPLLLGPVLARLYTPADWGAFALFATLAATLATVACGRYDHALPLTTTEQDARGVLALCLRVGTAVVLLSAVLGLGIGWWQGRPDGAPSSPPPMAWWWALPLAVASAAAVQAGTLWLTRAQRFTPLAIARLVHMGGGSALQVLAAFAGLGGPAGLVAGSVLAAALALAWLREPAPTGGWRQLGSVPAAQQRELAHRFADFPRYNLPHAFLGTAQDLVTIAVLVAWAGDASAGAWALAIRYLKAPATLVGSAVSQVLYPQLVAADSAGGLRLLRHTVAVLTMGAVALGALLLLAGPWLFDLLFGSAWAQAAELSQALAIYIAMHFIVSPLAVVTMAWGRQAWALKVAVIGQVAFLAALCLGLWHGGGLLQAAWWISGTMAVFYGLYVAALVGGQLERNTPMQCP